MANIMTPAKVERELVEPGIRRRRNRDGSISYEVDYRDSDGRQRRRTVDGGLHDARDFKAGVRSDMARGRRIAPTATTVSQAADLWLAAIKATDLKRNTIDAYGDSYRVHLEPRFGRRRLDGVTVHDVAEFLADAKTIEYRARLHATRYPKSKSRPTKPYAPRSIQLALTTLAQIYKHARRFTGYAGESPVGLLVARERPKIPRRTKVVLTPEQTARLVAAAPAAYADAIAFIAGTGVRVGEALGVPWGEVDIDNRQVTIRWTLDDDGRRESPKYDHCIRTIPIPGALAARLVAAKLATANISADAFVFQTTAGTAMNRHNLTRRGLWVACAAAGLPRISPHALRHGHGSALLERNWTLPAVSRRLGHRNTRVTAEVYAHELQSLERTARQHRPARRALRCRSARTAGRLTRQLMSAVCQHQVPRHAALGVSGSTETPCFGTVRRGAVLRRHLKIVVSPVQVRVSPFVRSAVTIPANGGARVHLTDTFSAAVPRGGLERRLLGKPGCDWRHGFLIRWRIHARGNRFGGDRDLGLRLASRLGHVPGRECGRPGDGDSASTVAGPRNHADARSGPRPATLTTTRLPAWRGELRTWV